MKIALASQNQRTLTPHAGKCRHFYLFDTEKTTQPPVSIHLGPSQVLQVWQADETHPLDGVTTLIAGSIGQGVAGKLESHGIHVLATPERDPQRIIEQFLDGSLPVEPLRTEASKRSQPGACVRPSQHRNVLLGSSRTWPKS